MITLILRVSRWDWHPCYVLLSPPVVPLRAAPVVVKKPTRLPGRREPLDFRLCTGALAAVSSQESLPKQVEGQNNFWPFCRYHLTNKQNRVIYNDRHSPQGGEEMEKITTSLKTDVEAWVSRTLMVNGLPLDTPVDTLLLGSDDNGMG